MTPHSVNNLVGDVAQLGERLNGIQEVEGSTPFVSTIFHMASHVKNDPEEGNDEGLLEPC